MEILIEYFSLSQNGVGKQQFEVFDDRSSRHRQNEPTQQSGRDKRRPTTTTTRRWKRDLCDRDSQRRSVSVRFWLPTKTANRQLRHRNRDLFARERSGHKQQNHTVKSNNQCQQLQDHHVLLCRQRSILFRSNQIQVGHRSKEAALETRQPKQSSSVHVDGAKERSAGQRSRANFTDKRLDDDNDDDEKANLFDSSRPRMRNGRVVQKEAPSHRLRRRREMRPKQQT